LGEDFSVSGRGLCRREFPKQVYFSPRCHVLPAGHLIERTDRGAGTAFCALSQGDTVLSVKF
jgi:hypothetical protein